MPKVSFKFRFIFDYEFYNKTIKEYAKANPKESPSLLTRLMHINAKSQGYSRRHNIISKKIFKRILDANPSMPRELLRSSFYDAEEPEVIENITDETERTIKYAIDAASITPFRTMILTSPEKEEEYLKNSHYKDAKEIEVKSGQAAINLIDSFWKECSER